MNWSSRLGLIALVALASLATHVQATAPDTFSPVVSVLYEDALNEPETNATIASPVVSYLFYEWPGDENVTFQNSQAVSYFYKDGLSLAYIGQVVTNGGESVAGASVSVKTGSTLIWQGSTDASGTFYAASLVPQNYAVIVTKAGYRTLATTLSGTDGGFGTVKFYLAPLPAPPQVIDDARTPAESALGQTSAGGDLKTFSGGHFVAGVAPNPNRPTVVLSHGWLGGVDGAGDWPIKMAVEIANQFTDTNRPNIVAWDWSVPASGTLVTKVDTAAQEGTNLGIALQSALGVGYTQRLHFIGHSLGTIVNRYACDYLHAGFQAGSRDSMNSPTPWSAATTQPHVTLLDEAELANVVGTQAVMSTLQAAALGAGPAAALLDGAVAAAKNWKSPLPKCRQWADNYISCVGLEHSGAVNVCLPWSVTASHSPIEAHKYAHQWYLNSIVYSSGPQNPAVGFSRAFEKALTFPPTGTGMGAGSVWLQITSMPNSMTVVLDSNPIFGECSRLIAADYAIQYGQRVEEVAEIAGSYVLQKGQAAEQKLEVYNDTYIVKPLDAVGQEVVRGYQATTKAVGNFVTTTVHKTGQVITESAEVIGSGIDATYDSVVNALDLIDRNSQLGRTPATPFFLIKLTTQARPQTFAVASRGPSVAAAPAAGQPAYAWMTVHVPVDVAFLAFDFTVTGQPNEDRIVCAINDQNVFNLPAKYAPDNVPSSTDQINVSSFAGQDIELFFGLTGGTSVNAEVAIGGIRFTTIPMPKLGIVASGTDVAIKWPAAATGWVLDSSEMLVPGSWQQVAMPNGVVVESGVATMEEPRAVNTRFYRLRLAQ